MSFVLICPNCGPREVYEFRYGGQILPPDPSSSAAAGGQKPDEIPVCNLPEVQTELWYHRLGCRRWLTAERDVRSNTALRTSWLTVGEAS